MRWLRRVHLFSGLFLLPWVLLYGVSGFLFNHGGASAAPRELAITSPQRAALTPAVATLVPRLLEHVDGEPASAGRATAELSGAWTFDFVTPTAGEDGVEPVTRRLSLPLDSDVATIVERRARGNDTSELPRGTFAAERERAEATAREVLAAAGVPAERLRLVGGPALRVHDGDRQLASLLNGDRVTVSGAREFDLGQVMKRLHVTHGYGRDDAARVVWAVFVDAMALAMVVWAFSGLLMWWQKSSLRLAGGITLGLAVLSGAAVVLALVPLFTR